MTEGNAGSAVETVVKPADAELEHGGSRCDDLVLNRTIRQIL
jgi:hypothetical protein